MKIEQYMDYMVATMGTVTIVLLFVVMILIAGRVFLGW
jgi:hypothetical protein